MGFFEVPIWNFKKGRGGKHKLPRVFTEHGAYTAAFVLRSPRAQLMSIEVIRAFIRMRDFLASHKELKVWQAIEKLSSPVSDRKVGFKLG